MRRYVGVLSVAVLPAFIGATAALGAPALMPSSVVSTAGARASEPTVAVSAHGRMLAAWVAVRGELEIGQSPSGGVFIGYGRVEARLGRAAHGWRGVQVLGADGESPMAAVGANGTAAVAWSRLIKPGVRSLYVSTASPGRPFGRARLAITGARVSAPEGLEVQPDGRVVLIWSRTLEYDLTVIKSRVEFALLGPHGGRSVIGAVSRTSGPGEVSVAETEDGDVLVAFPDLSVPTQQLAQLHPTARAFTAPQTIQPGENAEMRTAKVAAGPSGAALAFTAWGLVSPYTFENELSELKANGTFGAPLAIGELPGDSAGTLLPGMVLRTGQIEPEDAGAALPADGARVAAWRRIEEEGGRVRHERVLAAVRPAGIRTFGAPVQLSVGAGRSGAPLIASAGTVTLVLWAQDEPRCRQRVYGAIRPGGGTFAPASALSDSYKPAKSECGTGNGQLTLAGSDRDAIAGWVENSALHITTIAGGIVADK